MHPITTAVLIALQFLVISFVALHNWIPLGSLNDLIGVRAAFSRTNLFFTTLLNFTPFALGFAASIFFYRKPYPDWLFWWLWISYLLACYGSLKAWWIPYLFRPDPALAARYKTMYGSTHAFLPERNGIRPNTLHILFDLLTLTILIVLAILTSQSS
jgi:hypothetical protein